MGVQLPKYSQQVAPSGAGTGVLADPSKAGAGWETSAKLIGAGLELGRDYLAKKAALKDSADLADYEVRKRGFRQSLEDMETDALMEGVGQDELQAKVYQPAIGKFQEELQGMGYSKKSLGKMLPDWNNEVSKIGVELASKQNKRQIADYNIRQRDYAEQLMIEGDEDASNAIWDALEGTTRPGEAKEWKSLAGYKISDRAMQSAEGLRLDGTYTDDQYFDALGEIDKTIDASEMLSHHKQSAKININAKINNHKGRRVKSFTAATDKVNDKIANDDLEVADLIVLRQDAGDGYADAFEKSNAAKLLAMKNTDDDAKKALGYLEKFKNGKMSMTEVLRRTSGIGGTIGALAVNTAGQYAKDISENETSINAFEIMWKDQKMNIRGFTPDFIEETFNTINVMPDGHAEFANRAMKHIAKWQKANPEATDEEYDTMKSLFFGSEATKIQKGLTAPQVNSLPIGTVEGGYRYIGGDRYLESSWEAE